MQKSSSSLNIKSFKTVGISFNFSILTFHFSGLRIDSLDFFVKIYFDPLYLLGT